MKTLKNTVLGFTALIALFATQPAFSNSKVLVQCAIAPEAGFVGGVEIYRDDRDTLGILRGRVSDNYMSALLLCRNEKLTQSIRCVGIWTYGLHDEVEVVQLRLRKSSEASGYLLDVAKRARLYGSKPVSGAVCKDPR